MLQKRILIVDDDPAVLRDLSVALNADGFDVLVADDGGDAVSTIRREKLDLVLLDISLPPDVAHGGGVTWDGFLIMDWLRRLDEAKTTPVILMTETDPAQYRDRARAAGARGLFQKGIHNEPLLATIRRILGASCAQAQRA
jgi:DNA-binding response OmpR family regulator